MFSANGYLKDNGARSSPSDKKGAMVITEGDLTYNLSKFKNVGLITPPISPQTQDDSDIEVPDVISPDDEPIIAVLGVGYVGSHLVDSFSSQYHVIGFDVSEDRVRQLNHEKPADSRVMYSGNLQDLRQATHFLVSVPTLLRQDRSVDTSYLEDALNTVAMSARRGATVVVESSVAVGMTRSLLGPLALERGFFAGMSPERVDPGRTEPPMHSIPKVISGLDDIIPGSLDAIHRVYSNIFQSVVRVSCPEVAEMTKLYENCQRMVGIAYANEMADACIGHGIDPYEVSAAASTKPFGYMPFTPSLGVGGHCIPVNPFYLLSNNNFPLLEMATARMWDRPKVIAERICQGLASRKTNTKSVTPRILVVGMAFKAGQSHLANSPGVDLARNLSENNSLEVEVLWADALVTQDAIPSVPRLADHYWCPEVLNTFDVIVVAFQQHKMDMSLLDQLEDVRVERWYQ